MRPRKRPSNGECRPSLPKGQLPLAFAEDVKKRTNGRLVIEVFPAGALMPSKEVFPAVKRGTIPIGLASAAYTRSQIPLSNVCYGLPFTLNAPWEVTCFHFWLGFEQMMIDASAKHGVYFASGAYRIDQI